MRPLPQPPPAIEATLLQEDDGRLFVELPPPATGPGHRAIFSGALGCGACAAAALVLVTSAAIGSQPGGMLVAAVVAVLLGLLILALVRFSRWFQRARAEAVRIRLGADRLNLELETPSSRRAWSWPRDAVRLVRVTGRSMGINSLSFDCLEVWAGDDVVQALGLHERRTLKAVQHLLCERLGLQTGRPSPEVALGLQAARGVRDAGPRWVRWLRGTDPCPVWVPDPGLGRLPQPPPSRLDVRTLAPDRLSVRAPVEGVAFGLVTLLSVLAVVPVALILAGSLVLGPLSPFEGTPLEDPLWLRSAAVGWIALVVGAYLLFGSVVARWVSIDVRDGALGVGSKRFEADELVTLAVGYVFAQDGDDDEVRPQLEAHTRDGRVISLLTGRQRGLQRRGFVTEYEIHYLADLLQRALVRGATREEPSGRETIPDPEQ